MTRTPKTPPSTPPRRRLVRRPPRKVPARPPSVVGHEEIAIRAYLIFERDGFIHGHDLDHWLTAEKELLEQSGPERAATRVASGRGRK